jgi:hypothetical protein
MADEGMCHRDTPSLRRIAKERHENGVRNMTKKLSDEQLIRLAAASAGIKQHRIHRYCYESEEFEDIYDGNCRVHWPKEWSPLSNDGDALRLAMKHGFTVCTDGRGVFVSRESTDQSRPILSCMSEYGPLTTPEKVRRCIVHASAELLYRKLLREGRVEQFYDIAHGKVFDIGPTPI